MPEHAEKCCEQAARIEIEILMEILSNAVTNQPYNLQLQVSGTTPITWTYTGKIPAGLTLRDSGIVPGTPKEAGKSTFTVTEKNDYGKFTV